MKLSTLLEKLMQFEPIVMGISVMGEVCEQYSQSIAAVNCVDITLDSCLLYTSPSPRDRG